jgi:hypothetical protein
MYLLERSYVGWLFAREPPEDSLKKKEKTFVLGYDVWACLCHCGAMMGRENTIHL